MDIKKLEDIQKELMSLEKKPIKIILETLKEWGYDYAVNTFNYKTKELKTFSCKDNCNKALYVIYKQHRHASIVTDVFTPYHCWVSIKLKGSKLYERKTKSLH